MVKTPGWRSRSVCVCMCFKFLLFIYLFIFCRSAWLERSLFPEQGLNPGLQQWKCRVLTTGPSGKSLEVCCNTSLVPGERNSHPQFSSCICTYSLQLWRTLCDPIDSSPPGSSVHGILQARILEWVAMPSSRGSFQPRDRTWGLLYLLHHRRILYRWATREAPSSLHSPLLNQASKEMFWIWKNPLNYGIKGLFVFNTISETTD